MKQSDLTTKLKEIAILGFVPTVRNGDTGIGHTFEKYFGITENNIPIPDIGGRVEIKTCRKASSSMITLFTFNRAVWLKPQIEIIREYGISVDSRINLYSTLFYGQKNERGLYIDFDETRNLISLCGKQFEILAQWDLYVIVGKFNSKLSRVLFVSAESQDIDGKEHFHFNEANILIEGDSRKFIKAMREGKIAIDIRMHLPQNRGVRNHGTGFRCFLHTLKDLYKNVEVINLI